jgi:hypothetical protein
MKRELHDILEAQHTQDLECMERNQREAEEYRKAGNEEQYLELAVHLRLPDTCWALEHWDEARRWYCHNARLLLERRAWHDAHPDPDYPRDALVDWEATMLIKGGDLEQGRPHLQKAINVLRRQADAELGLSELGLHAAQVGMKRLVRHATAVDKVRAELPGGKSTSARKARKLLRYEPGQVAVLLHDWTLLDDQLQELDEARPLVDEQPGATYPRALEQALLAAAQGLTALSRLRNGEVARERLRADAREAFEEAMLRFYEFGGRTDWNTYFMRLNCRMVDDLADGRRPNPNPFRD